MTTCIGMMERTCACIGTLERMCKGWNAHEMFAHSIQDKKYGKHAFTEADLLARVTKVVHFASGMLKQ